MQNLPDHLKKARALIATDQTSQAGRLLSRLFESGERDFDLLIEMVLCHLINGQDEQARSILKLASEVDSEHSRVCCYQGFLAMVELRQEEALEFFQQSLLANPGNAEAYKWRGLCFRELGEPFQALADLNRAVAQIPEDAVILTNRGSAYADLGEPLKALQDFEQAIFMAPNHAAPHTNAAHILLELGRFEEARKHYEHAIELNHFTPDAWSGLAGLCLRLGEWSESLRCLHMALLLNGGEAKTHLQAAQVLLALGDPKRALQHLNSLLLQVFDHAEALLLKVNTLFNLGDFQKTWCLSDELIKRGEVQTQLYLYRALAQLELGVSPSNGPQNDLLCAHMLDRSDPAPLLALAEISIIDDEREQAARFLNQALSLNPSLAEHLNHAPELAALLQHEHVIAVVGPAIPSSA